MVLVWGVALFYLKVLLGSKVARVCDTMLHIIIPTHVRMVEHCTASKRGMRGSSKRGL
jgi:hypothetical protein